MKISMNAQELLNTLKTNRQKHIDEFGEQMQGWKVVMEDYGKKLMTWKEQFSNNIFDDVMEIRKSQPVSPSRPISFVDDYDKLIELLEHHNDLNIQLEQYEFDQIVKDNFGWKDTFANNTAMYSSAGVSQLLMDGNE